MFLDVDRNILFIHNPKAAGKSIRAALVQTQENRRGVKRVNTGSARFKIKNDDNWRVSTHSFASRIFLHPRVRDHYWALYTFGVVRNPWDRAVSLWEFGKQVISGQTVLRAGLRGMTELEKNRAHNECVKFGFEYFLMEFCDRYGWTPWEYLGPEGVGGVLDFNQVDWFKRGSEEIVDRIYLMTDLVELEEDLTKHMGQRVKIEVSNTTDHARYQKYYSAASRRWIEKRFARDITRFGFEFK